MDSTTFSCTRSYTLKAHTGADVTINTVDLCSAGGGRNRWEIPLDSDDGSRKEDDREDSRRGGQQREGRHVVVSLSEERHGSQLG